MGIPAYNWPFADINILAVDCWVFVSVERGLSTQVMKPSLYYHREKLLVAWIAHFRRRQRDVLCTSYRWILNPLRRKFLLFCSNKMNHQHVTYYHNAQLGEMPRHQIQHPGIPPGVPLVMNQPHGFVPYGIQVQRHSRPVYHSNQQPPHQILRHPSPAAAASVPVPLVQQHPPVLDAVRIRYPTTQTVAPPLQNARPEVPLAPPPPLITAVSSAANEEAPLDLSAKPTKVSVSRRALVSQDRYYVKLLGSTMFFKFWKF